MLENGDFSADLNGFRIGYSVRGKGPALMTVPNSWGLTHHGLRGLFGRLEERFTVVYFDPRGMGASGPVRRDSDMGMAAVREDFDALRRHLGLSRVNAIGWSNGALNLVLLASERPETLSAAVFVHGLARYGEADMEFIRRTYPDLVRRFEAFVGELEAGERPASEADALFKRFYVEEYFPACCADPSSARKMLEGLFADAGFSWAHTRYAFAEMPAFDFGDELPSIAVPSLVIAGAHDLLPPDRVEELAEGIPGARFLLFRDSGHFAPAEESEAFARAVRSFLGESEAEGAILDLETAALDRWGRGDPSGFLEISHEDVVYFDPFLDRRIDGLAALSAYYEGLRGKVTVERFELLSPKVQLSGDTAVLTFNYAGWSAGQESRWNCTEVFRFSEIGWKIIQTHWSMTGAGR